MLRTLRFLALAAATTLSFAAAAQQTITFTNNQPTAVTITLLPDSQVQIGTDGNLTASCQLDGLNRCVGLPAGGSGDPKPTVTLNYSGAATVNQNTSVTLTATISDADVCLRQLTATSAQGASGWSGVFQPGSTVGSAVLTLAPATYELQLRCFSDGGSTTSNTITITTTPSQEPPPANCTGVTPPSGYTQNTSIVDWDDLYPGFQAPFSPSQFRIISLSRTQYLSVRFTMPPAGSAVGSSFQVQEAQSGGVQLDLPTGLFYNISSCPGDFRYASSYPNPVQDDPNSWRGCRNWKGTNATQSIAYKVAPTIASSVGECQLEPGKTYYLNFILGNPTDGMTAGGEAGCSSSSCVFESKANN